MPTKEEAKKEAKEHAKRDQETRALISALVFTNRGDPSTWDWTDTDFTQNSAWHDLDCSSIVPAGAVAILFGVYLTDETVGSRFQLRKNGNSNVSNISQIRTQVANIVIFGDVVVGCDSSQVVEYLVNTAVTSIGAIVRGWWI